MNHETVVPNRRNILLLAAHLDALSPEDFDQTRFQHGDGSPSDLVAHMLAFFEPETWERAKRERNPRFAREQTARLLGLDYGHTAALYSGRPLGFEAESPTAKEAATMLKRMAWVKNSGINWPRISRWPAGWPGYSMSTTEASRLQAAADKVNRASRDWSRRKAAPRGSGRDRILRRRATRKKSKWEELGERLREAVAEFDLNELYDTHRPPQSLDDSSQKTIKRSAISSALGEIWNDVHCCLWGNRMPPSFDELTAKIRRRVDAGGPRLRFHEAVETYQRAFSLRAIGRHLTGVAADDRDHEIALSLWCLKDCGLPVTWEDARKDTDGRGRGEGFQESEGHPCLVMAMARATGIGESIIARAWRKFGSMR